MPEVLIPHTFVPLLAAFEPCFTAPTYHADHPVTGDRKLMELGTYQGVKIVAPSDFFLIV